MGRLTRRAEADGVKAVWYGKRDVFLEGEVGYAEADKLAHYEDLEEQGLLIELDLNQYKRDDLDRCTHRHCNNCDEYRRELQRYKDLEEQGGLLELPCAVGDTVYYEHPNVVLFKGIQEYQITNVMISQNKKGQWTKKYRAMLLLNGKTVDSQINFTFDEIGKTVFLTKEEAELKEK